MLFRRKGQGLPLNTIIISIIVIVVLVIVILIFTGQIGIFHRTAIDCQARGGYCTDSCPHSPGGFGRLDCPDAEEICCPILGQTDNDD